MYIYIYIYIYLSLYIYIYIYIRVRDSLNGIFNPCARWDGDWSGLGELLGRRRRRRQWSWICIYVLEIRSLCFQKIRRSMFFVFTTEDHFYKVIWKSWFSLTYQYLYVIYLPKLSFLQKHKMIYWSIRTYP